MRYRSRAHTGRRRATIKGTDLVATPIKGPLREEKGANKGSRSRGYTDQGPQREEKGDNKESGRRGYTDHGPAEGGEGR